MADTIIIPAASNNTITRTIGTGVEVIINKITGIPIEIVVGSTQEIHVTQNPSTAVVIGLSGGLGIDPAIKQALTGAVAPSAANVFVTVSEIAAIALSVEERAILNDAVTKTELASSDGAIVANGGYF